MIFHEFFIQFHRIFFLGSAATAKLSRYAGIWKSYVWAMIVCYVRLSVLDPVMLKIS